MLFLQVLGVLIAAAVALVAYAQWRTANQRVVMDLFERRLAVFTKMESTLKKMLENRRADDDDFRAAVRATAESRFLFGPEVYEYLTTLTDKAVLVMRPLPADLPALTPAEQRQVSDTRDDALKRILAFFREAPDVFAPYMRLDQRSTPFWRPW